ncbi:hypothetical protein ACNFJN_04285 [Xenorhabdus budapestensis]|uniref:hypothetical protein n=1 Tax=Xenorhabdus budapestensis TaxID=290110 RepID=UPI003A857F7D
MITIERTQYFEKWLKSLKDRIAKAKILIRVERMEEGNPSFNAVYKISKALGLKLHFTGTEFPSR